MKHLVRRICIRLLEIGMHDAANAGNWSRYEALEVRADQLRASTEPGDDDEDGRDDDCKVARREPIADAYEQTWQLDWLELGGFKL